MGRERRVAVKKEEGGRAVIEGGEYRNARKRNGINQRRQHQQAAAAKASAISA